MKIVLVFGVFDGLHSGHIAFLQEASTYGDHLVVAVARDSIIKKLKHRNPHINEKDRCALVKSIKFVDRVILGDTAISSYKIIKKIKPSIVCFGYDQQRLAEDFKQSFPRMKTVFAHPYKKNAMHSSKLRSR